MEALFYILANGCGDRVRGSYSALIGAFIFAAALILNGLGEIIGMNLYLYLVLLISAYMLGEAPGWGEPLGAYLGKKPMRADRLEGWQIGILKHNAALALLARGFIWGLPIGLVIGYADPALGIASCMAFTFSMLAAARLALLFDESPWERWKRGELIRGILVMALMLGANNWLYPLRFTL